MTKQGHAFVDLKIKKIPPEVATSISYHIASHYKVLPIEKDEFQILLAMANPFDIIAIDEVSMYTGLQVNTVQAEEKYILQILDHCFGVKETLEKAVDDQHKYNAENSAKDSYVKEERIDGPVIKLVNSLFQQAIEKRASDIHLEPFEEGLVSRFRIDGILYDHNTYPSSIALQIKSRLKIMANMDIAEKRIPQDGQIHHKSSEKNINLRVSTLPVVNGEKVVIRILEKDKIIFPLAELGFNCRSMAQFSELIRRSSGLILVVGPTGCGKSTTLYSALNHIATSEQNIVTVENPVEYRLNRVNQVSVNFKAGLDFPQALRSILRQDPDVIMVGEIRDASTASITVKAAQTGHLVFSTLHTNNAAQSITRLLDMGVEGYMLNSALTAIVSQRLIRLNCQDCLEEYEPKKEHLKWIDKYCKNLQTASFRYGKGCPKCDDIGFKGRVAVHEVMILTESIKRLIMKNAYASEIHEQALLEGLITLHQDAVNRALLGQTTLEEIFRALHLED